MSIYLEDYPGALEPRRTPFAEVGEPLEPSVFIYMTNRYEGRWSYLMPPGFERRFDPASRIPMGYTQLWIMEKIVALAPEPGKRIRRAHELQFPNFEAGVVRDDFLSLFHVLREPVSTTSHNDHIGGRRRLQDARSFAKRAANQLGLRVVVAKLIEDWTWH